MNRNRIIRILQSVLCVLLAVLLAAAAIGICREGLARKASDPLSPVFTPAAVGAALRAVLPLLALSLAVTVAALFLGVRGADAGKPAPQKASPARPAAAAPPAKLRLLRAVLLVLALVLIAAGVWNGSARDVFCKAVKICTECVGLG